MNHLSNFPSSSLYPSDSQVFGTRSTNKNFASGKLNHELIAKIIETCRKQLEKCESFQVFQFFHSIGGGTGSGLMKEVLNQLVEENPSKNFVNFVGIPGLETANETINSCLAIYSLVESSNLCVCFDNCKIFEGVSRTEGFSAVNSIIRQQVSDFTSLLRYPGNNFSTYQKINTFLSPFIRLHFYLMNSSCEVKNEKDSLKMMIKTLDNSSGFYKNGLENSRTYSSILISRGKIQRNEKSCFNSWVKNNPGLFVDWIKPCSMFHSIETSNSSSSKSFSYIQNSQDIRSLFLRLNRGFGELIREKVQLGKYLELGMDEMEFFQSESDISDLCSEYSTGCTVSFSGDDDDES
jgi:tubulin beta